MTTLLTIATTPTAPVTRTAIGSHGVPARRVPAAGGLNRTLVGIELRRLLRNPRTLLFGVVMPAALFLAFGAGGSDMVRSVGRGNVSAFIMISMGMYGALLATTSGGAMVAKERAEGWSRQLRLTPLAPWAYIAVKITVALVLGLLAVGPVFVLGAVFGAHMPAWAWAASLLGIWAGSSIFAALGLAAGYLLPSENVMQILGPAVGLLAFGGGLFMPIQPGSLWDNIARFTPMYGINNLVHAPLTAAPIEWTWVVNVAVWLAVFVASAVWLFRRDTARV